jgi:hypothetical protein
MRNKTKPCTLRLLEQPLRSIYGLPRHVRKLIGEEVAQSLVGKRLGDTMVVRFPDRGNVVLWRGRGCGGWSDDDWCEGCESWTEHVRVMELAGRKSESRAKQPRKGGAA